MLPKKQEETGGPSQLAEPGDAELASSLRDTGDRAAFAELMRRHGPTISTFLSRLTGGQEAKLLDRVYWRLQDRSYAIREPEQFVLWALGMAASIWREEAPRIGPPTEDAPRAWRILSRISYPLRPVFVMVHYLRLPLDRVAFALRIPRNAALARLHDAFASLAVQLLPAPKPPAPPPEPKEAPAKEASGPPPPPSPPSSETPRPLPWAAQDKSSPSEEASEKNPPPLPPREEREERADLAKTPEPAPKKEASPQSALAVLEHLYEEENASGQKAAGEEKSAPEESIGAQGSEPGKEERGSLSEGSLASPEEPKAGGPLSTLIPKLTALAEEPAKEAVSKESAKEEEKGAPDSTKSPGSSQS